MKTLQNKTIQHTVNLHYCITLHFNARYCITLH